MKRLSIFLVLVLGFVLSACENVSVSETPTKPPLITESRLEVQTETQIVQQKVYLDFTEERYNALVGQKPFAIFFHAPWCGTCRRMEADILGNLSIFPEGTVILKADYDTEKELEKKYGIRSQSTVVIIDQEGEMTEVLVAPSAEEIKESFSSLLQE